MQEKMSSMVASSRPLNTGTRAKGRLSRSEAFIQPVDWKKTAGRCGGSRNYDLSYLKWANLEQPLLTPPHRSFNAALPWASVSGFRIALSFNGSHVQSAAAEVKRARVSSLLDRQSTCRLVSMLVATDSSRADFLIPLWWPSIPEFCCLILSLSVLIACSRRF